jgi:hypothetical protein
MNQLACTYADVLYLLLCRSGYALPCTCSFFAYFALSIFRTREVGRVRGAQVLGEAGNSR